MKDQKHVCGVCQESFDTEEQYLDHQCTTGFTPTDVEHQDALTDGQFSQQAAAAQGRGEAKAKKGKK
jgi:hypothetical protein